MQKSKILIIEDETTISRIVANYFQREGFETVVANDGEEGMVLFERSKPDIIVLDIMMPKKDGWQVMKEVRATSSVPIIVMSALSTEEDILRAYSNQVDDYIAKPFNPRILIAKVKSILNRVQFDKSPKSSIESGAVKIDLESYKVFIDGKEVNVSKTEYELLLFFLRNEGKICSREILLGNIWGETKYIDDRIIDTYVKNLRKYLGKYKYIKTVFGIGYRFETNEEETE